MKKNILHRIFLFLLGILLLVPGLPSRAEEEAEAPFLISEMISYYSTYQRKALTDLMRLYDALFRIDPAKAERWRSILEYWDAQNGRMDFPDTLPDTLPQDGSLCLVVLGLGLNDDGSMKEELVGRLEVAHRNALLYPNARILCTGGATARENPEATEGGEMTKWLTEQGIPAERILTEDRSRNTTDNARLSLGLLAREAPEVRQVAVITSDYHLGRSCLFFYAESLLSEAWTGKPAPKVTGRAAFPAGRETPESASLLGSGLATLAGVKRPSGTPLLSELRSLELSEGPDSGYRVTAVYSSGYSRDITELAQVSETGPDPDGRSWLTAAYAENGTEHSVRLLTGETVPPSPSPSPEPAAESAVRSGKFWIAAAAAVILAAAAGTAAALGVRRRWNAVPGKKRKRR